MFVSVQNHAHPCLDYFVQLWSSRQWDCGKKGAEFNTLGLKQLPCAEALSTLQDSSLQSRRLSHDMIKVYTIVKKAGKQIMKLFFTKSHKKKDKPE